MCSETDGPDQGRNSWNNAVQGTDGKNPATAPSSTRPADRFSAYPDRITYETTPPMMDDGAYWDAFPTTLTTGDVAKILSVGKPAVLTRLKSGVIPGHLIVGSWIIFKAEVRAWLESTSNQAPPGPPELVDVLADYAEEMSYRDLMELFGKTKQTIYTWLHSGEIPAFHASNRWIIHKPQLRQKLAETSNQKTQDDQ